MGVRAAGALRTKGYHGKLSVGYRDARGIMRDAVVTGAGTGSTYNIRIRDLDRKTNANQYKTNVALATGSKQTDRIFNYAGQI